MSGQKTEQTINPLSKAMQTSKRSLVFATFSLLLTIATIAAAGYFIFQLSNANDNAASSRSALLQKTKMNAQKIETVQSQTTAINKNLHQALSQIIRHERMRILSQVNYLLQAANVQLTILHHVSAAEQLLVLAKKHLNESNDPLLLSLKKSINGNLIQLKHANNLDQTRLLLKIDSISQAVQDLKTTPKLKFTEIPTKPEPQNKDTQEPWYKKLFSYLSTLKGLVILRHATQTAPPLLSPGQEVFLKENIQAKLIQAEWALIYQRPEIFRKNLVLVAHWMKTYLQPSPAKKTLLAQINALVKTPLPQNLPNISDSIKITEDNLSEGNQ